jgi:hypothetical protein
VDEPLDPGDGAMLEPEVAGEDGLELPLDPAFCFDPELSQPTSDKAESNAAAISHFLSIMRLLPALYVT